MKRMYSCAIAIALFAATAAGPGSAAEVVYAVGGNAVMLELRNGEWLPVAHGLDGGFSEIWGSSPTNIYATGFGSAIAHFDGVAWQKILIHDPAEQPDPIFYTIDGCGPYDIWIGGWKTAYIGYEGYIYHFNGSEWTYLPKGDLGIKKIWANPAGGYCAYGKRYAYPERVEWDIMICEPVIWSNWAQSFIYLPYSCGFSALGGLGPNLPVAAGYTVNYPFSTPYYFAIKGCCEIKPCSTCLGWPVIFTCVSGTESDMWLGGENGTVLHWTPTGHTLYNTGVARKLRGIWAASSSDVYAVGDYGTIVHFDGATWTVMPTPTTATLVDIWGYVEAPIATLLQSQSADVSASGVTIRWSLSDFDEGTAFRVSRSSSESAELVVDDDPRIERENLTFTYVDADVVSGASYTYVVEHSSADGWLRLLEAGPLTVPAAPFALMTNYPNPFNPATAISYSIREQGNVALKIYDVTGALVATLVDEALAPGEYTAHWNGLNDQGASVASGTYFCRLSSAKQSETRKILLMR